MAKLSTVDKVRGRIGYDSISTINNAIDAGLESASVALRKILRTPFDSASYSDKFMPRYAMEFGSQKVVYLALSAGFLTASPAIVYAYSLGALAESPIEMTDFTVDLEKGLVTINTETVELDGIILKVTYNAGFTVTDGQYGSVPDWLATAAEGWALTVVDRTNPSLRGDSAQGWSQAQADIRDELIGRVRYFPSSERPL